MGNCGTRNRPNLAEGDCLRPDLGDNYRYGVLPLRSMTPAPCPTLHTNRPNIACLATQRMRTTLAGALLASLVGPTVLADAIVTYTQNFDTLPTSSTSVGNTGAINLQAPITQISATNATWQATRISGTNTTAMPFNVGTGSGNTGGLYSYATSGSSDRSLGLFASGTTVPAAGLALVNTSTFIVTSVNISFTSEQWRSPNTGGVVNTTSFAYGFSSNTAITDANFLSSSAMVSNPAGDLISGAATTSAVFGAPAEVSNKAFTISNVLWKPGDTLYIRWRDTDNTGADAGLAIDDLTVVGSSDGDADGDGFADPVDNCPEAYNPTQIDCDGDGVGDACAFLQGATDLNSNGVPDPCDYAGGDIDLSGNVDSGDVALALLDFGPCAGCASDIDGSGDTDAGDIALILLSYGEVPYSSPYRFRFTVPVDSLIPDMAGSRGVVSNWANVSFSNWYSTSTRNTYGSWGPRCKGMSVPTTDILAWPLDLRRQRLFAFAQRYIGLRYQHHHLPEWDPPADWPWDPACTPAITPGADCSNFTGWIYNWCYGIQVDTDIDVQAVETSIPLTGGGTVTVERISKPSGGFNALVAALQPGDLCFVYSSSSSSTIVHVYMWLGTVGTGPSAQPLVLDATSSEPNNFYGARIPCGVQIRPFTSDSWYYTRFSHAHRLLK